MTIDTILEYLPPYAPYILKSGYQRDKDQESYEEGYNEAIQSIFKILKENSGKPPERDQLQFGTKLLPKDKYEKITSYKDIDSADIVYVLSISGKENYSNTRNKRLSTGDGFHKTEEKEILVKVSYLNHKFQSAKSISDIMNNYIIIDNYLENLYPRI